MAQWSVDVTGTRYSAYRYDVGNVPNVVGVKDPLARLRRIYVDPGPYSRIGEWTELAASKLGADRILFG